MRKINENIAYAKSILNKVKITPDSTEYQDYLKIREICGTDNGYVGILTKLRFIDNVTDIEELKSIFEILKKSKFDFAKLNKLTYQQILDSFFTELSGEIKNKDIELIYKDKTYSYYQVYTYEGILKIGSPAWCLKTKSMWNTYHEKYPLQWVVIANEYVKKIITPENNYLSDYRSSKGWIRYGISVRVDDENNMIYHQAFADGNVKVNFDPNDNHTFWGVMCTIFNLLSGHKESYYDRLNGCQIYSPETKGLGFLKIIDKRLFCERVKLKEDYFTTDDELYVSLSTDYEYPPRIIILNDSQPSFFTTASYKKISFAEISGKFTTKIFEDYALKSENDLYSGIKLKLGKITMEDIEKNPNFIKKIGNWLVFDRNENFYIVVNANPVKYEIPYKSLGSSAWNMNNPLYWYINKKTKKNYKEVKIDNTQILNEIEPKLEVPKSQPKATEAPVESPKITEPKKSKIKRFWDFMKKK